MNRDELNERFHVTDDQLNRQAAQYEDGSWQGITEPAKPGRPRLYDDELETISFRLPKSRIDAIDAASKQQGESRSEFIRRALDSALLAGR